MSLPNAWARKSEQPSISPMPEGPSMREIMDEEVARELQMQEEKNSGKSTIKNIHIEGAKEAAKQEAPPVSSTPSVDRFPLDLPTADECANDFLLAKMLQEQFDREHDKLLNLEEQKLNGNEKIQLSFKKYRSTVAGAAAVNDVDDETLLAASSSDDDAWAESDDVKEMRNAKLDLRRAPEFGASGVIKKSDGGLVTKHDKVVCGRKNTDRVMEFPPEFLTGDVVKMDTQLPNSVYNTLKTHMISEEKRLHKIMDKKDKATSELALDMKTRIVLYKMINSGLLDSVTGTIAAGKEAIVLHARGGTSTEAQIAVPAECALKVYITMLVDFKNRAEYVKEDYRFKNRRKVLKIWAEKEFMNLNRMRRAGVRCPSVVKLKKHILVMSFIGEDGVPAPKLKEVQLDDQEAMKNAFDECVEAIKLMYSQCNLIHGDFSEFNVLYWQGHCYVIDVAQSMDLSHPKSLIFLARDCYNLVKYFNKIGMEAVPSDRQLFVEITAMQQFCSDDSFYTELEEYVNENACQDQRRDKRNAASDIEYRKRH